MLRGLGTFRTGADLLGTGTASPKAAAVFFFISSHFLSVYLWFEPVDWHFSLYWENSYLPRVRVRAESRVTNRSEGMFVSASPFLGTSDRIAIHEIFIVLATSGHPCSWREGMV